VAAAAVHRQEPWHGVAGGRLDRDSGTRSWLQGRADLVAGAQQLRWRCTTDASHVGRGVYVDGVRVTGQPGVVLDGERDPEEFVARGWSAATR